MSLNTGKLIPGKQFTLLPITKELKKIVEELALAQNQHVITGNAHFLNGVPTKNGKYGPGKRT